jgi:chromate reductase
MPPATAPRILAFAGSTRRESFNRKLLRVAVAGAERAGAACTVADLREFPLPLYDADLEAEAGLPRPAAALRELLGSHRGLLIASPEYNSSISPLLKNTIDWASRSPEATQDLSGFRGKLVALMAASPGALGGLRGLVHLRALLGNIGCTVLADQLTLSKAAEAFAPDGSLVEAAHRKRAEALGATLTDWVSKLDPA